MQFFKFKDYIRSWSTWILGAVTVTPVLNSTYEPLFAFIPDAWKPYVLSALGVLGLVARSIKQK